MKRFMTGFGIGFAVMLLTISLLGMIAESANLTTDQILNASFDSTNGQPIKEANTWQNNKS